MTLTAVDTFARLHDEGEVPDRAGFYRDLLPLAMPGPGEQYAFEVDLDACTGCKSCVVACHSLNGLDEDESWRSVGLLQGGGKVAFQQTVTTACHHCVEPACLTGCPVDAYEKDPITGIVAHLDDQCIGCSYCTLTCPYEVPRFNEARGIVRKCDMCRGRLAVGEAPACVQSCPNGAIRISIVDKAAVVAEAARPDSALVPGAPASSLTAPTTSYRTARPQPAEVRAADHYSLRPAHPHPPLAAMLVLTQLSVGLLGAGLVGRLGLRVAAASTVFAIAALAASTMHLGRPRYAFRAVLGWRHSWLSREVIAFGLYAPLVGLHAVATAARPSSPLATLTGAAALVAGVAGIACSVMLYAVTGRRWWRARRSALTFALSSLSTGALAAIAVSSTLDARGLAAVVIAATTVKLVWEASAVRHDPAATPTDDLQRSSRLLRRDLWNVLLTRLLLGAVGGVVVPLGIATARPGTDLAVAAGIGTVVLLAGELVERHLFFRVAVAPRMPGELR